MKKQKIQLIVLVLVGLICVGGYFLIRSLNLEEEPEETETVITDFAAEDVTELTVSGDVTLDFVKEDDTWTENSIPEEPIVQGEVETLISRINHLTTTETVLEAPADLSEYGLSEPFRTVTATLSDQTSVTIHMGNESSLLGKYYIQVEGSDSVYLISAYIVSGFEKAPEDFIEEESTEETATEETDTEEIAAEETTAEETAAEETDAEETVAEETGAEETVAGETAADETAAEETIAEETAAEETAADETAAETAETE